MKHTGCTGEGCPLCPLLDKPGYEAVKKNLTVPLAAGPSLVQRGINLVKATIQHTMAGLPMASPAIQAVRLKLCHGCTEAYDPRTDHCRLCGCNMTKKASWLEQTCPLGKW